MKVPQGVYSDPGWQLKAVQQYQQGVSPAPNSVVMADPKDLSRDMSGWISWWAPGTEMFAWPLMRFGLSPGAAVRAIASGSIILGAFGWALWISLFGLQRWLKLALCLLFPWMQYAHNSLFLYSAEALVFAAVPWALLMVLHLSELQSGGTTLSAATGAMLGFLYVLKYSAAFVALGALVFLIQATIKRTSGETVSTVERRRMWLRTCVCVCAAAVPVLGLSLINRLASGTTNVVTALAKIHFSPSMLLFAVANPALIAASADAPLRYILLHPTRGLFRGASELPLAFAGLAGGIVLMYLLWSGRPKKPSSTLARILFAVSVLCMLAVWTLTGGGVSHEARHLAGAGLAALPCALEAGCAIAKRSARAMRWTLAAVGVCYVLLPLAYGATAAIGKFARQSTPKPGLTRLYNPLLAREDVSSAMALLHDGSVSATDVWYITDPVSAMEFSGRVVIRHADFMDAGELRREVFRTSKPLRVRLVLPASFEKNGKAEIIRSSFADADAWSACPTDGITRCWTSSIRAHGSTQ